MIRKRPPNNPPEMNRRKPAKAKMPRGRKCVVYKGASKYPFWRSPPGKPPITEHWGGYMPFPPDDCLMRSKAGNALIKSEGVEWIDNVICEFYCKGSCGRRKEFDREMKEHGTS